MIVTASFSLCALGEISEPENNPAASSVDLEEKGEQRAGEKVFALKTFVVNLADPGGKRYLRVGIVLAFKNADLNRSFGKTAAGARQDPDDTAIKDIRRYQDFRRQNGVKG
jgi:flagellar basal body-associated protein FliL